MLTSKQRRWLADKLGDLANLATAALLFGQFTNETFRPLPAAIGLITPIVIFYIGNRLLR